MAKITFNIDKKLAKIFEFILDYSDSDKTILFCDWKENPTGILNIPSPISDETCPLEIEVEDKVVIEFNFLCRMTGIAPDDWFIYHVRNYCAEQLPKICEEIKDDSSIISNNTNLDYPENPGRYSPDAIPDEYWHYLVGYDRESKKNIENMYEIAFRCRIAQRVRERYGENVYEIEDLNHLYEIERWLRDNPKNSTDASAMKNYINYKQSNSTLTSSVKKSFGNNEKNDIKNSTEIFTLDNDIEIKRPRSKKELTSAEEHNLYVVGYVHSRNWSNELYPDIKNETERLQESADRLAVKESVLRTGPRDQFDYCVRKEIDPKHNRVGWANSLPDDMRAFFDKYKNKDRDEIMAEAREILCL